MKKAGKAISVLMAAVLAAGVSAPAAFAAAPSVQSDTTMDFTVGKGNTYAFKFTVIGNHSNPQIAAGNGAVLRTENTVKKVENGNDTYYFKVRAIGSCGQESAVYTTLPGQSAVRHCKIKVGVQHHKDDYKNGAPIYYYGGEVQDKYGWYNEDGQLAANRKKQYLIDYMSYMGYTHNASLDSANVWTTPTAKQYSGNAFDSAANVEKALDATAKDLVEELKKHKATEYGINAVPDNTNVDYNTEQIIPTFKSNLTYATNLDPVFTSKYYQNGYNTTVQATATGGELGCNDYVVDRAKEITGISISDSIHSLVTAYARNHPEEYEKVKATGYLLGTEPKQNAIAMEPGASSLGHFEYVEAVDGDNVTLSGANTMGDLQYYGRVTRTKITLEKWNTVYIYLK